MSGASIYHLAEPTRWPADPYVAESLATEGFIHCSTAEQLSQTYDRYYAGRRDLVLLTVDPAALDVRVEHEFPHVYGHIPASAVISAVAYRR